MSQQARKEQESTVVRRLTLVAGSAALGLAWYFTSLATSAVPLVFGAQGPGDADRPVIGPEQLDDHVFVRTVHVPAMRAPAGGVTGAAPRQATAGSPAGAGQAAATSQGTSGTSSAAASGSAAQPVAQPATSPPAPAPTPVATTGASTPAK
jgi:hypothetical protein